MGLTGFQGDVVNALNNQDARNLELLDQVVSAADAVSNNDSDVTIEDQNADGVLSKDEVNAGGGIMWGGKHASLQGTGGVALLEFAKDAIQTAVSNISGMGTNQIQARKIVERKIGGMG